MKHKILFLDVDGVLLGKARPDDVEIILAKHVTEFLEYSLAHFTCFWLTTHCHEGDSTPVVNLLGRYANEYIIRMAKKIFPASWKTLKTEVIDIHSDFYWIDDQLLWSEIQWLKSNDVLERWIQVDTRRNPEDLKRAISILQEKLKHSR